MKNSFNKCLGISVALLFTAAACSTDDDSSDTNNAGNSINSGLPAESSIGDLSGDDAVTLCAALNTAERKVNPTAGCTFYAVMATTTGDEIDTAACETMRDECVVDANADNSADTSDECDSTALTAMLSGCTATVAEIEACESDSLAAQSAMVAGASCDTAGTSDYSEGEQVEVASCAALATKCPTLYGDDEGGETDGGGGETDGGGGETDGGGGSGETIGDDAGM